MIQEVFDKEQVSGFYRFITVLKRNKPSFKTKEIVVYAVTDRDSLAKRKAWSVNSKTRFQTFKKAFLNIVLISYAHFASQLVLSFRILISFSLL